MFVLRVQSPNGIKRIEFKQSIVECTWGDLQREIQRVFGVQIEQQQISLQPLFKAQFVTADSKCPIAALEFKHGDMIYLAEPLKSSSSSSGARKSSIVLTKDCRHGDAGRCMYCAPASDKNYKPMGKCNHGAGATCTNCSQWVKSESKEIATWLCAHPPHVFCPKCQPPEEELQGTPKKTCECVGTQKCVKCLNRKAAYKVDVVPYAQIMAEKKALCKYKHDASATCAFCAPPVELSYKGDSNCKDGHRPWPLGICGKCRPPNAILRLQKYRHVDGISFKDLSAGEKFIAAWQSNSGLQKCAILFGKYIDEPVESQNKGAIRAEVYGLYMPPQEFLPNGVEIQNDPYESDVIKVAAVLGLVPIGWAITTLPRDASDNSAIFMSGTEIRQAAKYQQKFSDEYGHSRFVTMVVQYNEEGTIEPKAYQISDQGVAMERDNLLQEGSSIETLAARKGNGKEYIASIIFKDRALNPGEDFIPDELLVKVVAMKPYNPISMFAYKDFPLYGGNKNHAIAYLRQHQNESLHQQLSDFAFLCHLPRFAGLDMAIRAANLVHDKSNSDPEFTRALNAMLS